MAEEADLTLPGPEYLCKRPDSLRCRKISRVRSETMRFRDLLAQIRLKLISSLIMIRKRVVVLTAR